VEKAQLKNKQSPIGRISAENSPNLVSSAPRFSHFSLLVHHPVIQNDWHLLAHGIASDFSVTRQFFSERTIGFSLGIKLHALI
jgi:hypothetical protein